jgi:putative Mg2+ transporter-C (MgtC) family protein
MAVHEFDILWRLGLALVLSAAIGLEREVRQKSAGLRTHALVGVGSALFMIVSIYGFSDVLSRHVTLDPSRVAAQIVSGIGFIGGGIIFVRRDIVRGLTTAAAVWVVAAVGMACGGDLPVLAVATTLVYMLVAFAFPPLVRLMPQANSGATALRVTYLDGYGILRDALARCTGRGFAVADVSVQRDGPLQRNWNGNAKVPRAVVVRLMLHGRGSVGELVSSLSEVEGVVDVLAEEISASGD